MTADLALTQLLRDEMVDPEVLLERYRTLQLLVEKLLGVVPNCDPYLEIWPPAFRTYNVMVPNLLNLPIPVFGLGGPPPGVLGTAMFVASSVAGCPYCTAHSCSFAMRRGAPPEAVAAALLPGHRSTDPGELAAVAVARSLAHVPSSITQTEKSDLIAAYGEKDAEWLVLGVVMMGFLNKVMDSLGVELEQKLMNEVAGTLGPDWNPGKAGAGLDPMSTRGPTPPVDSLRSRLGLVRLLPGAIRFDREVQRGVPSKPDAVRDYLRRTVGHDFPLLASLHSNRARRAIATMLTINLDPVETVVGVEAKLRAGAAFAAVADNEYVTSAIEALARYHLVDLEAAPVDDPLLVLARAISPSPTAVDASTIEVCRDGGLKPAAIVEVVTWVAVLQMLHRLTSWLAPPA